MTASACKPEPQLSLSPAVTIRVTPARPGKLFAARERTQCMAQAAAPTASLRALAPRAGPGQARPGAFLLLVRLLRLAAQRPQQPLRLPIRHCLAGLPGPVSHDNLKIRHARRLRSETAGTKLRLSQRSRIFINAYCF